MAKSMLKCANCQEWFVPDRYNAWHQRFCTAPECRKTSGKANQVRASHLRPWQRMIASSSTQKGLPLKPRTLNKRIESILMVTKLNTVFESYPNEAEAIASFAS